VSVNGSFAPPHGAAFDLPEGAAGLCPALSAGFGAFRCNFGSGATPFRHAPPDPGFRPMANYPPPTGAAPKLPCPSLYIQTRAPPAAAALPASPAAPTKQGYSTPSTPISPSSRPEKIFY
jgi:hypothetical protein